ncbi:MAG: hypothetical protein J6U54_17630 [Clostridiales bacterium]|nr:hypothetical protein [Clostridiales bacterium]
MNDSILTSVKKGVGGIVEMDESFDDDILLYTNTVFSKLAQLGVGPKTGFRIEDKKTTWTDFVGDDPRLEMVKSFVILSVRMLFDPPTSGSVAQAMKDQIAEYEWRLQVQVETPCDEEPTDATSDDQIEKE